jgi:hypothetical protein
MVRCARPFHRQTQRAEHDCSIAARVQLGDYIFAAAVATGQVMPLEQMLDEVVAARS